MPFKQGVRGSNPRWSTKKSPRLLAGRFFLVAPGESKFIPDRGNPRWSTKKILSPFGGRIFFRLLPGSRSSSPIGEIPAGAPKNLLAFWRGDFFPVAPGESKFIPDRGNPRWSTKRKPLKFQENLDFSTVFSFPFRRALERFETQTVVKSVVKILRQKQTPDSAET